MKFVRVGSVAGSFGLDGVVKIKPVTENPQLLFDMEFLPLGQDGVLKKSFRVLNVKVHGDFLLYTLDSVDSEQKAKELRGFDILLPEDKLPEPDTDEVYWYMIDGAAVNDINGNNLGVLVDYMETGSNDVFRIKLLDGSYAMLSNNKDHCLKIDPEGRIIIIDPIGLVSEEV